MTTFRRILVTSFASLALLGTMPDCHAEDTYLASASETSRMVERSPVPPPRSGVDLREAFAKTVLERNIIRRERDALQSRQWLIVLYALLVSAFASWLGVRLLRRAPLQPSSDSRIAIRRITSSHERTAASSATRRANAVITIRNSQTQLPEMTDRVATRRMFSRAKPAKPVHAYLVPMTAAHAPVGMAEVEDDYTPTVCVVPQRSTAVVPAPRQRTPAPRTPDLRVEQQSDAPVSDPVVISRGPMTAQRVKAFTLLEITISVAVLVTVLVSVAGGMLSLNLSQQINREDAAVHEIMHLYAERVMGGDWDWLGRERSEDTTLLGGWSWQREETVPPKIAANPPLREDAKQPQHNLSLQLLDNRKSGVGNLSLYLEYYKADALTASFRPTVDERPSEAWSAARKANRMTTPIDLRQYNDAVVVRIYATWDSQSGGPRHHELVFARRR
jgi:hypothetical protein